MKPALRIAVALGFASALVGAAVMSASGSRLVKHSFSHRYPPDRTRFERPKVQGHAPLAAWADTIKGRVRVESLSALARRLPRRTLRRLAPGTWLLTAPVDVVQGARVLLRGGRLELAPGSFVQARSGGAVALRAMTIVGVDTAGRPLARPTANRAFLAGRDGGRLALAHDRIRDLGHLGVYSYGIAFRHPGPGTSVTHSTIDGNYFGVYLSGAVGARVSYNRVSHSVVYGIDPYGYSRRITISGNTVSDSGLHGIVLANHVSDSRVVGNTIDRAGGHGIVLYRGSRGNLLLANTVRGSFDGIVLTDASHNTLERNRVGPVVRFGLRLSDGSSGNRVVRNVFDRALLGAYLYGGAAGNRLLDNTFASNRENVRLRADAPRNVVSPAPSLSEGVK